MYRIVLKKSCKNVLQNSLQKQSLRNNSSNRNIPLQAGFGKLLILLAPVATIGGVVTYANYDKEFRKTVETNVPGSASVIKILLQEENPFKGVTETIDNVTSTITGFFGSSGPAVDEKPKIKETEPAVTETPIKVKTFTSKETTEPKIKVTSLDKISTSKPLLTPAAPIKISKSDKIPTELPDLEIEVEKAVSIATQEYTKAIKVLKNYNEDVRKVVDDAVEKYDLAVWNVLKNKTAARDILIDTAEKAARDALQTIEKCELVLSKNISSQNQTNLDKIRDKIKKFNDHINVVKDELFRAKDNATLSEKYWKKVESARNYYINEIESIFPGLNLSEKKMKISNDDLDLFLIHAYSHVLVYQKEIQRLEVEGELRLKRAIEALRGENKTEALNSQLDYHLEKEKRKMAIQNQTKIFQIRAELEKELRKQLKRQSEAHVDHLQDALNQKESELKRKFSIELDEKLSSEKAAYKLQLATMLGKLKGMDAALKARADSEKCAHQAQSLWAACQALWASVRTGEPGVHWRQKLRPLKNEIKAVEKAAAEGDELVAVVLKNLPEEAQVRGVYPEDALRERFINVEKLARKLALVPEEGAGLPMYLLSYIQAMFIMQPSEPISQEELQNKIIDFSKLDTYDILNRARYYMDRGDLMQALKYMNLLQGASRKISSDWMNEARLLLETQQAANTLMAHAAASGLFYL